MPIDYTNGKIYKIVCNITGDIYIGSTTQPLSKRIGGHRDSAKSAKCVKSKSIILGGDYAIILIENYPCESKEELLKKERYYIENNICLNKQIPLRTDKEYRDDNKDKIKDYREINKDKMKEYNKKNRDKINKNRRELRAKNKELLITKQIPNTV
jgi:hypothetical protein